MPITWRNLVGPSLADAARPMELARRSIDSAFDRFGDIINKREATEQANVQALQDVAKQRYLSAIQQARTPEALAQLQQSGQLDQLRSALDPKSLAAVRGADEDRLSKLYSLTQAKNTFEDSQLRREQAPVRNEILSLAALGQKDKALALVNQNPNMQDAAELTKAIVSGERDLTRFNWDANSEARRAAQEIRSKESHASSMADARATRDHLSQLRPIQRKGAQIQNELGTLNVEAGIRNRKQAEDDDAADAFVQRRLATHIRDTEQARNAVREATKGLDIPRTSDGSPDVSQMSREQQSRVNALLKDRGISDLSVFNSGDTKAFERIMSDARKQEFTPRQIARIESSASQLNTGQRAAIGIDAQTRDLNDAQFEAAYQETVSQYGNVATPGNVSDTLKTTMATIDKITDNDNKREDMKRVAAKWLQNGGIKTKDGARIIPNAAQMEALIYSINQSWFNWSEAEIRAELERWAEDPDNIAGALQVYEMEQAKRNRNIGRIKAAGKKS